jgi:hypothetical protein
MRLSLQILLILFLTVILGVNAETAAGGGGGGTAANSIPSVTSTEAVPDTTISGIKGINPDTSATTKSSELAPSGPTSTSTMTNGGGGGGGTFTQTTTFQSSSASASATAASDGGRIEIGFGGFWGVWSVIAGVVIGVIALG